jgi:molecular chaperone DnaK
MFMFAFADVTIFCLTYANAAAVGSLIILSTFKPATYPAIFVSIEVDANGIMTVNAKDKATGKENRIRIERGRGLSEDEIDQMVQDAEANADADKERKELVEAKNQAEGLIHSTNKSLEEHSDKVDPTTVEAIELAVKALEDVLESEDADKIKSGIQNVTEASMKLGEAIYKASAEAEGGVPPEGMDEEELRGVDEDIVDADFEDLSDDEQK